MKLNQFQQDKSLIKFTRQSDILENQFSFLSNCIQFKRQKLLTDLNSTSNQYQNQFDQGANSGFDFVKYSERISSSIHCNYIGSKMVDLNDDSKK